MRKMPKAMYLWPGLPQLWMRGSWSALMVAVGAAALLNLAMLGSFGWTELIDEKLRNSLWIGLGILWLGAALVSAVHVRRQSNTKEKTPSDDPFNQALDLYLKGDYYQVESLLNKILNKNVRDIEARLLLATLQRHTGRIEDAIRQLDQLDRFDGAEKWALEIQRERELLTQANNKAEDKPESGTTIAQDVKNGEITSAA